MRVAVLWPQLSGYADAMFAALVAAGHDVLVVHRPSQPDAPFVDDDFDRYERLTWPSGSTPDHTATMTAIERLDPNVVLMSAWHGRTYREVLRVRRGRAVRVLGMDNQWRGRPKQWLGRVTASRYLHPLFDAALVSGYPQAEFARRLGFRADQVLHGFCSADTSAFGRSQHARPHNASGFVFVGRLAPEKGLDVLAQAWDRYRREGGAWTLDLVGTGPMAEAFDGLAGVQFRGFVQPSSLPGLMAEQGCLVLPSRFEPWGVVVHEAASAGLPLICTDRVGARTQFLRPGINGLVVPAGDAPALTRALLHVEHLSAEARTTWSAESRQLGMALTPQRWAANLVDGARRIGSDGGLRI